MSFSESKTLLVTPLDREDHVLEPQRATPQRTQPSVGALTKAIALMKAMPRYTGDDAADIDDYIKKKHRASPCPPNNSNHGTTKRQSACRLTSIVSAQKRPPKVGFPYRNSILFSQAFTAATTAPWHKSTNTNAIRHVTLPIFVEASRGVPYAILIVRNSVGWQKPNTAC